MALMECPECKKEVSSTVHHCTNCGFVINKPKRGITGKLFKGLFILFNAVMIVLSISMVAGVSHVGVEQEGAKAIVGVMGFGTIIFVWILIGLPLGIMNYITRPKAYE